MNSVQDRLDYKLGAKVQPEQRRVELEARTAETSLILTNALTLSGTAYALASRTLVNDVEALILDARRRPTPRRPTAGLKPAGFSN